MGTSTTRILTGIVVAGALGFGVVGARADSTNGPDAGIGIEGYNLDYDKSADGSGRATRAIQSFNSDIISIHIINMASTITASGEEFTAVLSPSVS